MVIEMVLSNSMGVARVDNNTLLFHDKGAGVFKGISIYPNRIEAVVKNNFFGTIPRSSTSRTLRVSTESRVSACSSVIGC